MATASLILLACRGEENNVTNENSSKITLHGTWFYNESVIKNGSDGSHYDSYLANSCRKKTTWTFNSDGTFAEKQFVNLANGSCQGQPIRTGTYTYNENTKDLSFMMSDGTHNLVVKELAQNEVRIQTEHTFDWNGDGIADIQIEVFKRL